MAWVLDNIIVSRVQKRIDACSSFKLLHKTGVCVLCKGSAIGGPLATRISVEHGMPPV